MTYDSPRALRQALEQRLLSRSKESGLPLDRLRRQVMFERLVVRLERAEPGIWVLKGGMALEVRLGDQARLTKDVDLGLRESTADADALGERLSDALDQDADGDGFVFDVGRVAPMAEDGAGQLSWRAGVQVRLAGRAFGRGCKHGAGLARESLGPAIVGTEPRGAGVDLRRDLAEDVLIDRGAAEDEREQLMRGEIARAAISKRSCERPRSRMPSKVRSARLRRRRRNRFGRDPTGRCSRLDSSVTDWYSSRGVETLR